MNPPALISLADPLIPFARIPRAVCRQAPPHLSTVARWAFHGVGSPPVRLATVKVGGRRYTTAAAIEAFVAATNGGGPAPQAASDRREAAILVAEHALDAEGV